MGYNILAASALAERDFGNCPFCLREIANEALVIFMVPHHCSHGEVVIPCGHENYKLELTEMSDDLTVVAGEVPLEDRLAAPMAMALARLLREAEEAPAGAEQRRTILDVARQLSQLRRESHQAERVRMERERWAHKELELLEKERQAAQDEAIVKNTMAEFPHLTFGLRRKAAGLPPKEPGVGRKRKARRARPHPSPPAERTDLCCTANRH
jgi:hypothetical protein